MGSPHWHGHIEVNYLTGASMTYDVDGTKVTVQPEQLVIFWAGVPHQLVGIHPESDEAPRQANIYLPFDSFLNFGNIAELQIALLSGAILSLRHPPFIMEQIEQWYRDYRTHDFQRTEVIRMEMNALFRRATLDGFDYLLTPRSDRQDHGEFDPAGNRHVVSMLRFILENLDQPMTNADIAGSTGLHANYALTLFSRAMRMPPKRFVIRMRLLRARVLLLESALPVASIAGVSGFSSASQFYSHFKATYGIAPNALRETYRADG